MNLSSLQFLTWSTVTAAVASALALAAVAPPPVPLGATVANASQALPLPTEPTAAGPQPAASAVDDGSFWHSGSAGL